jgi:hypothetical protein
MGTSTLIDFEPLHGSAGDPRRTVARLKSGSYSESPRQSPPIFQAA